VEETQFLPMMAQLFGKGETNSFADMRRRWKEMKQQRMWLSLSVFMIREYSLVGIDFSMVNLLFVFTCQHSPFNPTRHLRTTFAFNPTQPVNTQFSSCIFNDQASTSVS